VDRGITKAAQGHAAAAAVANFLVKPLCASMDRPTCTARSRALPRPLVLGLGAGLIGAMAVPLPARAVDFPRPGVVCDGPRQVCFDGQGPSIPLTRQYYGYAAGNQLLAQLSGRPPESAFLLSGGQLCDISQRVCWDDGWRRRMVSPLLSRHLFGAAPATGPIGGPGVGPNPAPQPPAGERMCQLTQRGMPVFKGPCRLYRQSEGFWQYYVVQMGSGQLYRFQRRANLLVLSDATGTWPVLISDRGNTVQFRWANLLLDVSRPMQARGGVPDGVVPPSPTPRSTGETGQDLLNTLFQ
jgi:hypothetical protein